MNRTVAPARTHCCASAHPVPLITYLIIYSMYPYTEDRSPDEVEVETQWVRAGRGRQKNRFLKGPVSLSDLHVAAQLPGHALHLYIATRHLCDLRRAQTVTLSSSYLKPWGLDRHAKRRALAALELAGLISVDRHRGRATRVTLIK